MINLDKTLEHIPCPDCGSLDTECYDGTELGNAFICNACAENFVITADGSVERYGKEPTYTRSWRNENL